MNVPLSAVSLGECHLAVVSLKGLITMSSLLQRLRARLHAAEGSARDTAGEAQEDGLDVRRHLFRAPLSQILRSEINSSFSSFPGHSGNGLLIGSSTATILALTWGGVTYDWSSWRIIVPLVLGLIGLVFSCWFEAYVHPRDLTWHLNIPDRQVTAH